MEKVTLRPRSLFSRFSLAFWTPVLRGLHDAAVPHQSLVLFGPFLVSKKRCPTLDVEWGWGLEK